MEAVIWGITEDRKCLVLSINGVGLTACRDFAERFTAMDIRNIVGEPEKQLRIPVLRLAWKVDTDTVPMYRQVDTLVIAKL